MKFTSVLLSCLAVSLLQGGVNLLDNPEFRSLDAKGVPSGWFTHGSTVVSVKDGSLTLSLPAKKRGDQKDAAIMQHLRGKLAAGSSYVLTAVVSAPEKTAVMLYVEGWYMVGGKQKWWSSGTPRFEVGVKGAERRIVFTVPAEMERIYLSMRSTAPDKPVTFTKVRVEEFEEEGNLLRNADFKDLDARGVPAGWFTAGKSVVSAGEGAVTLSLPPDRGGQTQATLMQHLADILAEGMTFTVTAHVSAPEKTAAMLYVEGEYTVDGQRRNMITDTPIFPVDAKGTDRRITFTVPGKMDRIYLALRTTAPDRPVTFSKVSLKAGNAEDAPEAGKNLLTNPDFSAAGTKGAPAGWFILGKTVAAAKDGALTLSLAGDRGNQTQATIMQYLTKQLKAEKTYVLTARVSAPEKTAAMLYIEGEYTVNGKRKWLLTSAPRFAVDAGGTTRRITFTVPGKMDRVYLSMRTTEPDKPVTFSELKLQELIVKRHNGGYWDKRYPGSPADGIALPAGQSAVLRHLPVRAGHTYKLSFKVTGSGKTGSEGYPFYDYRISSRPVLAGGVMFRSAVATGTPGVQYITVPQGSDCRAIDLTFSSQTFGELKFSGVKFEEAARPAADEWFFFLTEPCYRDTIYPRTDTGAVAGVIRAGAPAVAAEVALTGFAPLKIRLDADGKGDFRIPAADLPEGKYPMVCRILDDDGRELKRFETVLRKVPAAEHEVLIDARQTILADGKPFFPIVEYRTRTGFLKGGFYHMARHGINTVMLVNLPANEKHILSILDRLHALQMKAVIEIWSASSMTPESKKRFIRRFNAVATPAVRRHPALLAYFTNDEPFACYRNPAPIIWTRRFLSEVDPYHPVWVGQSPRDVEVVNLRPYAEASDITGIDIYPLPVPQPHCDLPDKSINCVGAYTRRIGEVVRRRKPVWMALQAFEWHDHNFPKNTMRRVYPTEDETRYMFFDALFNGSRAVVLYGTPQIKSVPYREMICRIAGELRELSGLMTGGDLMPDLPHKIEKARIARIGCRGRVYYGIFNQEPKRKVVAFAMDKPLIIYREGRRLVPNNGVITVSMRPNEVIVCGAGPLPPPVNFAPKCDPELEDLPDPAYALIRSKNEIGKDPFADQHYPGNADWIWNKAQAASAGSSCVLFRKFTLNRVPEHAELLFCADDEADAYLNGRPVGSGDEHGRLHRYDVTKLLKEGENLLLINARDGGGLPCAMMAEMRADGETLLVSDGSWRARAAVAGEDFRSTMQTLPTTPAFIAAPAGKGPWGRPLLPEGN